MKWIPEWLAKSYAGLYVEKEISWFEFEDAKKILFIEDKRILSLRLSRLEEVGYLVSKRDSIDKRKKYFRVLKPNDIVFAYGMASSEKDIIKRLVSIGKKLNFVIGGTYATYVYTGYASPGKIDIYSKKEDVDIWIPLLSEKLTSVSVDDVLSGKLAKTNFHIHASLNSQMINESVLIDGIRYVTPENLIITGLIDQNEFSITDSLAILIKKRKEINFDNLINLAKSEGLEREIGACLEIINFESTKKIFDENIIRRIRKTSDLLRMKNFPRNKTEESLEYKNISDKWGLKICLSRAFVSKIITDLIR